MLCTDALQELAEILSTDLMARQRKDLYWRRRNGKEDARQIRTLYLSF